jgi:hypothetical protein
MINVLDFIPAELHASIRDHSIATSVLPYIRTAMRSAPAVHFPAGTYPVSNAIGITGSGTALIGDGVGVTILKLMNGADDHLISVSANSSNVTIRDMTIDGNKSNSSGTGNHGLRIGGVTRGLFENLCIVNAYHYGIGMQEGTNIDVKFSNITISGVGGDAIDIKNMNDNNRGLIFENIYVASFGQNTALESGQAGIDLRGPCELTNIVVEGVNGTLTGIRFRFGENGDPSGSGGHQSHLSNFRVSGAPGSGTVGVAINARHVKISNGYVIGTAYGVATCGDYANVVSVTAEGCPTYGFRAYTAGSDFFTGSASIFAHCTAATCGYGFVINNNVNDVTVFDCTARKSTYRGISVNACLRTQLLYNNLRNNGIAGIIDNGTDTVNVGNKL